MSGWTLTSTDPIKGRTFQRPLSPIEHSFLWEGRFNGHCDILRYLQLRLSNGAHDADLLSDSNVQRAWVSTKRRFPLAGAIVQRITRGEPEEEPYFVVRECDLSALRPSEIIFGHVADAAEAQSRAAATLLASRPLSDDLLVQLGIFRETGTEARGDVLHVTIHISHCVADEMASRTLVRCFLDTLARGSYPEPAQAPLEDRLAMVTPIEELEPAYLRAFSPARRRWRRAAAALILQRRFMTRQGGHSLPCRLRPSTRFTTAHTGLIETSLTQAQTQAVIAKCRRHKIAFESAYLPLAQVGMTRVLYRRYLRGEISEEEWAYRKQQPYITFGPANLRPYLDKAWFERGGGSEFMTIVDFCTYRLPFMTLGATGHEHDKTCSNVAPAFSDLLTFDRSLHRAGLVKKQAAVFFNHPLFFELKEEVLFKFSVGQQRANALQWRKNVLSGNPNGNEDKERALSVMVLSMVPAHSGSSLDDVCLKSSLPHRYSMLGFWMDSIFPFEYPIPRTHILSPYSLASHPSKAGYVVALPSSGAVPETNMTPTIVVELARTHNHARPGQIYLGAEIWGGKPNMFAFYDNNVFEEMVVREWVEEVKAAVMWYLT